MWVKLRRVCVHEVFFKVKGNKALAASVKLSNVHRKPHSSLGWGLYKPSRGAAERRYDQRKNQQALRKLVGQTTRLNGTQNQWHTLKSSPQCMPADKRPHLQNTGSKRASHHVRGNPFVPSFLKTDLSFRPMHTRSPGSGERE